MQLSYAGRLICLALCSAGLLQLLLEYAAWLTAPHLLRETANGSARRAERSLFLLALFARLSPWLVVLCAWVPAYMRGEDNLAGEHVGLICVAGAAAVLAWALFGCLRALQAWASAQRCCRSCREAGTSPDGLPVLLYPGERPLLAVVGVFRSRILVSQSLLTPGRFPADALDSAFQHESAHARHHDNLKLLLLSLLPHVPFATGRRRSLEQHWRLAAEIAADEDGTMGRPDRSVLLAELLITVARESKERVPHGAFALLSRADDLHTRVDRLLQRRSPAAFGLRTNATGLQLGCVLALSLASLCCLCVAAGHRAAELLLHLG